MMKTTILVYVFILVSITLSAQEKRDVVYLKDGSVIKGQITEIIPSKHVKVETVEGDVFFYSFIEIEKIEKEEIDGLSPNKTLATGTDEVLFIDFYNHSSLGIALGGGGVLGLTSRYFLTKKIGIEGGIFIRPGFYQNYNDVIEFTSSAMIAFGPVFYSHTYENWKGKIKKSGISMKAGFSPFGELKEFFGAVNWVYDTYRPDIRNHYFSYELGAGAIYRYELPFDASREIAAVVPLIYWKVNWFFEIK